jgi:hypothetical protein
MPLLKEFLGSGPLSAVASFAFSRDPRSLRTRGGARMTQADARAACVIR